MNPLYEKVTFWIVGISVAVILVDAVINTWRGVFP